ncbi:N-methylglutamate synthase subunit B [Tamaricihabitans halophyticus]|uniref:N-methylglutamate synthase subunit B n=1 Tax=Tamaricihabitans halophyticus TaxID=1262583 RepID=A0A4V2SRT8_9PSEU|nr:glutamate synthase [Tamaricihabitans halophyticus]TCP43906.1 N-methylglutamate synthase subunit B [Tamaricihabitans halophyticus]
MVQVTEADTVLNCAELSTREVNAALAELPDGTHARITEPWGRHNLAVGLSNSCTIEIAGNAGYFIGGLGAGPAITVHGFVGWSVGENLMSGSITVHGNASECAGASAHGGRLVIHGDASARAGISLKGGTVLVGGDVGHMSGFMAQAGVLLVGGDAGDALGDSLYETVIYVAGRIASLGADARIEELTADDVLTVKRLVDKAGFDHIDPENVKRVASAKQLYNFDALKDQKY